MDKKIFQEIQGTTTSNIALLSIDSTLRELSTSTYSRSS